MGEDVIDFAITNICVSRNFMGGIAVLRQMIVHWCHVPSASHPSCASRAFLCIPVHSPSFIHVPVIFVSLLLCSVPLSIIIMFRTSLHYYYVPYLSPLLFHISILGSGCDELDQQTEFSARSDYILSFYCLCLRIPPCHSVNPVLIVYLHISPLGSSYCSPPYISPHKP